MTPLLTPREAARYLRLSLSALMTRVKRGEIACIRSGVTTFTRKGRDGQTSSVERGLTRFRQVDLDTWSQRHYRQAITDNTLTVEPPLAAVGSHAWERRAAGAKRFS